MNFFEHQARARRKTRGLVALFALALVCIVVLVDLAALVVLGVLDSAPRPDRYDFYIEHGMPAPLDLQIRPHLGLLLWVSALTAGGIGLASQYRIMSLRSGGGAVARGLGGTLVSADTTDPQQRRLRNVVEEMAIASGVPVPEIYVLQGEPGINAFAAGFTPADAAVAVTQGTLETLDRAELQAVVAHEMGHILNGDMRLNIRLMGVLFGILAVGLLGRILLRTDRASVRGTKRSTLSLGVVLVLIGYVGLFFGRLIKASVSRQREYLADASAVQFTRQPDALAGALKKIGASAMGSVLRADAEEVSHMLFSSGFAHQLFATHPPLVKRIRAIQPRFDPRELTEIAARMQRRADAAPIDDLGAPSDTGAGSRPAPALPLDIEALIASIGQPGAAQVKAAGALTTAFPPTLERAARSGGWVTALLCYLLMAPDPEVREQQGLMVAQTLGEETERQLGTLLREVPRLDAALRLPLLEIAFPVLRGRPEAELIGLGALVERLTHATGQADLFAYATAKLLAREIDDVRFPSRARHDGPGQLADSRYAVFDLLSILAYHGHGEPEAAGAALEAGLLRLGMKPEAANGIKQHWLSSAWLDQAWAGRLDTALEQLARVRLVDKQRLLGAVAATVMADAQVSVAEGELLRAICAVLRMPLPVLLPPVARA